MCGLTSNKVYFIWVVIFIMCEMEGLHSTD